MQSNSETRADFNQYLESTVKLVVTLVLLYPTYHIQQNIVLPTTVSRRCIAIHIKLETDTSLQLTPVCEWDPVITQHFCFFQNCFLDIFYTLWKRQFSYYSPLWVTHVSISWVISFHILHHSRFTGVCSRAELISMLVSAGFFFSCFLVLQKIVKVCKKSPSWKAVSAH